MSEKTIHDLLNDPDFNILPEYSKKNIVHDFASKHLYGLNLSENQKPYIYKYFFDVAGLDPKVKVSEAFTDPMMMAPTSEQIGSEERRQRAYELAKEKYGEDKYHGSLTPEIAKYMQYMGEQPIANIAQKTGGALVRGLGNLAESLGEVASIPFYAADALTEGEVSPAPKELAREISNFLYDKSPSARYARADSNVGEAVLGLVEAAPEMPLFHGATKIGAGILKTVPAFSKAVKVGDKVSKAFKIPGESKIIPGVGKNLLDTAAFTKANGHVIRPAYELISTAITATAGGAVFGALAPRGIDGVPSLSERYESAKHTAVEFGTFAPLLGAARYPLIGMQTYSWRKGGGMNWALGSARARRLKTAKFIRKIHGIKDEILRIEDARVYDGEIGYLAKKNPDGTVTGYKDLEALEMTWHQGHRSYADEGILKYKDKYYVVDKAELMSIPWEFREHLTDKGATEQAIPRTADGEIFFKDRGNAYDLIKGLDPGAEWKYYTQEVPGKGWTVQKKGSAEISAMSDRMTLTEPLRRDRVKGFKDKKLSKNDDSFIRNSVPDKVRDVHLNGTDSIDILLSLKASGQVGGKVFIYENNKAKADLYKEIRDNPGNTEKISEAVEKLGLGKVGDKINGLSESLQGVEIVGGGVKAPKDITYKYKEDMLSGKVVSIEATVDNLPKVSEGMTRLYRAENPKVKFEDVFDTSKLQEYRRGSKRGEFYTSDFAHVDYFRSTYGKGTKVKYIDVPNKIAKESLFKGNEYILDLKAPIYSPGDLIISKISTSKNANKIMSGMNESILQGAHVILDAPRNLNLSILGYKTKKTLSKRNLSIFKNSDQLVTTHAKIKALEGNIAKLEASLGGLDNISKISEIQSQIRVLEREKFEYDRMIDGKGTPESRVEFNGLKHNQAGRIESISDQSGDNYIQFVRSNTEDIRYNIFQFNSLKNPELATKLFMNFKDLIRTRHMGETVKLEIDPIADNVKANLDKLVKSGKAEVKDYIGKDKYIVEIKGYKNKGNLLEATLRDKASEAAAFAESGYMRGYEHDALTEILDKALAIPKIGDIIAKTRLSTDIPSYEAKGIGDLNSQFPNNELKAVFKLFKDGKLLKELENRLGPEGETSIKDRLAELRTKDVSFDPSRSPKETAEGKYILDEIRSLVEVQKAMKEINTEDFMSVLTNYHNIANEAFQSYGNIFMAMEKLGESKWGNVINRKEREVIIRSLRSLEKGLNDLELNPIDYIFKRKVGNKPYLEGAIQDLELAKKAKRHGDQLLEALQRTFSAREMFPESMQDVMHAALNRGLMTQNFGALEIHRDFKSIKDDIGIIESIWKTRQAMAREHPLLGNVYHAHLNKISNTKAREDSLIMGNPELTKVITVQGQPYEVKLKGIQKFYELEGKDLHAASYALWEGDRLGTLFKKDYITDIAKKYKADPQKVWEAYSDVRETLLWSAQDLIDMSSNMKLDVQDTATLRDKVLNNPGYMPHTRLGEYFFNVTKEGKRGAIANIGTNKLNSHDAELIRKSLMEQYAKEGYKVSNIFKTNEFEPLSSEVKIAPGILELLNRLEKSREVPQNINELIQIEINKMHVGPNSFGSRFFKRENIQGQEMADTKAVLINHFKSNASYVSKIQSIRDMSEAIQKIDPNLPKTRKEAVKFMQDMLRSSDAVDMISGRVRSLVSVWHIGYKISNVLVNLTQNLTSGTMELGREVKFPERYIAKAMFDRAATRFKKLDPDTAWCLNKLQKSGKTKEWAVDEFTAQAEAKWGDYGRFITDTALWMFKMTERFNRESMGMAAFRVFKNKGLSNEMAYKFAANVIDSVHFIYGKPGNPGWMSGKGGLPAIARTGYTFMHYPVSYMNLFIYNARKMGRNDRINTLRSLGWIAVLGGIPAGLSPLGFGIAKQAIGKFAGEDIENDMRKMVSKSMFDLVGKEYKEVTGNDLGEDISKEIKGRSLDQILTDIAMGGIPTAIPGSPTIAGTLETMGGIPKIEQVFGVLYNDIKKLTVNAPRAAAQGDYVRFLEEITPSVLSTAIKGFKGYKTGLSKPGGAMVRDPETGEAQKFNKFEAGFRAMGFLTNKEYVNWNRNLSMTIDKNYWSGKRSNIFSTLKRGGELYRLGNPEGMEIIQKAVEKARHYNSEVIEKTGSGNLGIKSEQIKGAIKGESKLSQREFLRAQRIFGVNIDEEEDDYED